MKKKIACVAAVAMLIGLGSAAPASADEGDLVSATATASALAGVSKDLLLDPVDSSGFGRTNFLEGSVEVSPDPKAGVLLETDGFNMSISLPGSEESRDGVILTDGTITYPGNKFSNSVIQSDNGVQLLTTIANVDSPTKYEYEIDLPSGATLADLGGGLLAVVDEEGNPLVLALPAWAVDAEGTSVPTRYALEDGKLVQYVEHTGMDVSYPVVADPRFEWLGPLPTVKLTRSETYNMRYSAMPAKLSLCVSLGGVAGAALAAPCALSIAALSVRAGDIYASGKCLRVVIGPGVLGAMDYKDSYCK